MMERSPRKVRGVQKVVKVKVEIGTVMKGKMRTKIMMMEGRFGEVVVEN